MQLNRPQLASFFGSSQSHNVKQFINSLVDKYRPKMKEQQIILETDFDTFEACIHPALLHAAAANLVENAMEAMPHGGEISITLIDGRYQWELEVADSLGMAFNSIERRHEESDNNLPVVIPFPETEQLRNAHRAAIAHGGQIQTWSCPQGGTAHVLVIPRQRVQSSSNNPNYPLGQDGSDRRKIV